jgi:hypothetical protein
VPSTIPASMVRTKRSLTNALKKEHACHAKNKIKYKE